MQIQRYELGPIGANCYIYWSEKSHKGVMIDPGGKSDRMESYIRDNNIQIDKILLTHGHFDHISGLDEAKKLTWAKVYISKEDAGCLTSVNANISTLIGRPKTFDPADVLLHDGDVISVDDEHELKVILTPGHTPGGCCFYGDGVVFTGDTLFFTSVGRTDFPGGSYADIKKSLKRLMELDDETIVYPGHGEQTTIGFERTHNPFV